MKFEEKKEHSKPFFVMGFILSYLIFSSILTFILKYFKGLKNEHIFLVFLSTAVIVLIGGIIKKWLE